ncbi:L-histidine N(alpha)-methyltransferase [Rubripirellula amarantea]|uniref:L-histidine N(alpha)-methyltransferase n=1 Tax=Rubripirellula amarantea TaxID=2527999 RepID=UPI001F5E6C6D|nr:L-histidine N(alpha)-methyltransferase [Rubripirellula amarantea]
MNKTLPCKYFYDEVGSQLFDQICELDEYYPTRTELKIMIDHADEMASQIDRDVMLVELGSGSSIKTKILLDALIDPVAYVPVDISEEHLLKTAEGLRSRYTDLEVLPVVADFTKPFELPIPSQSYSHVALYFPGSTIGNFEPDTAVEILGSMAELLGPQGGLLIGIDLQKDIRTLVSAYDDASGVTSQFNLNLLSRINRELDGTFDLSKFSHKAIYNEVAHRIEISIVSLEDQSVSIGDDVFHFFKNEEILTEYSHKYSIDGFAKLAGQHGFSLHQQWTDEDGLFAVLHLVLDGESS